MHHFLAVLSAALLIPLAVRAAPAPEPSHTPYLPPDLVVRAALYKCMSDMYKARAEQVRLNHADVDDDIARHAVVNCLYSDADSDAVLRKHLTEMLSAPPFMSAAPAAPTTPP